MSSVPPNTPPGANVPPGGGAPPPYPPYDPMTNWRAYREQQRAAWRAQRYAWKANYAGVFGPRVPSIVGPLILVFIGAAWLLVESGHISAAQFWSWYGHWWPVLLIIAGIAMLGEWALDMKRSAPVRRRSHIGLILLLVFLGLVAIGNNHLSPWIGQWNGDNGDFFNMFGMPEHDNDQQEISEAVPAGATIDIENPRGDVSVTAGAGSSVVVEAHEIAYADSDSNAKKIFDAEKTAVRVNGTVVVVQSGSNNRGRVNMTVTVPAAAHVTVNAGLDDVTAAGLNAGIDVTARGDIHLSSITGPVVAHFTRGRHDVFAARDVQGNLTLEGNVDDITLSNIKGAVGQNGDIPGDVSIENITGPIHLHTSVTDLQVASLDGGDLTLDSDDLRVTGAKGPVRVTTHSKDVDLIQVYGDSTVDDRDGSIAIEPAGAYAIDARNSKGDVEITLPPNAQETVEGRTHNGDIVTDFGLNVSGDTDKTLSGRIGAGGPKISLNTSNGDLRIKKGSGIQAAPVQGAATPGRAAPELAVPGTRHLKTNGPLPQQPVTQ